MQSHPSINKINLISKLSPIIDIETEYIARFRHKEETLQLPVKEKPRYALLAAMKNKIPFHDRYHLSLAV